MADYTDGLRTALAIAWTHEEQAEADSADLAANPNAKSGAAQEWEHRAEEATAIARDLEHALEHAPEREAYTLIRRCLCGCGAVVAGIHNTPDHPAEESPLYRAGGLWERVTGPVRLNRCQGEQDARLGRVCRQLLDAEGLAVIRAPYEASGIVIAGCGTSVQAETLAEAVAELERVLARGGTE